MKLDDRSTQMLKYLLKEKIPVTIEQISNHLDISRRSFYYTLDYINVWMKNHGFEELVNKRGIGIALNPTEFELIEQRLHTERNIIYTMDERVDILMFILLSNQKQIHIENLVDYLGVSRNTLFNDLKRVRSLLNEYDLDLEYIHTLGYQVTGDLIRVRTTFLYYHWNIETLNKEDRLILDESFVVFRNEDKQKIYEKLKKIESQLNTEYVIGTMSALSNLINVIESITQTELYFDNSLKYLESTQEYALVKATFHSLKESEIQYISLHLLGARTQVLNEQEHSPKLSTLAVDIVEEFERISAVKFKEKTKLIKQISSHLSVSYFRYIYGIHHGNPLTEYIKEEYASVYKLTDIVCDLIRTQLEVPVADSEVAFITLHFCSYLNRKSFMEDIVIVDIVCPSGISTSNMIHTEVLNLHPQIKVRKVMSLEDYHQQGSTAQYIITTVPLDDSHAIKVNPIMNNEDRVRLLRKLNLKQSSPNAVTIEDIMLILSPYIKEDNHDIARSALVNYFDKDLSLDHDRSKLSVLDLLNTSVCEYVEAEIDWKSALAIGVEPLIINNSVEAKYLDAMISGVHKFGPYMILENGYMMAHASQDDGVNKLALSYTQFKHDVVINNKHFNKLFILSPIDQSRHINIMKDLMSIFSDDTLHTYLNRSTNIEDSIKIIRDFLKFSSES